MVHCNEILVLSFIFQCPLFYQSQQYHFVTCIDHLLIKILHRMNNQLWWTYKAMSAMVWVRYYALQLCAHVLLRLELMYMSAITHWNDVHLFYNLWEGWVCSLKHLGMVYIYAIMPGNDVHVHNNAWEWCSRPQPCLGMYMWCNPAWGDCTWEQSYL